MIEIKTGQEIELNNVLSFRGKLMQNEIDKIGIDMEAKLSEVGAKRNGNPITATFGIEGTMLDIELLLPIDKNTGDIKTMEMVLNNGFSNLNEYELVLIDGGVDWDLVGATVSTVGFGYIGTQVGAK